MHFATSLLVAAMLASSASASLMSQFSTQAIFKPADLRLVETGEGIQWITEAEKLRLKRAGKRFMDITDNGDLGEAAVVDMSNIIYPQDVQFANDVKPLLAKLSGVNMKMDLEIFTSFYTRYYKSKTGADSSMWLFNTVKAIAAPNRNITVFPFHHSWPQTSLIAKIPGINAGTSLDRTIVVGAHQDSIDLIFPSLLAAPGADDDGSGTVTILETFRVLVRQRFSTEQHCRVPLVLC